MLNRAANCCASSSGKDVKQSQTKRTESGIRPWPLSPRQRGQKFPIISGGIKESLPPAGLIIRILEARTHRAAEQSHRSAGYQARSLPYILWHHQLHVLVRRQIASEDYALRRSVRSNLQHFHRIAVIEMEDFIGSKAVHLGKCSRLQQVV